MKRNKMLDFILYHKSTLSGLMAITLILTSIFYTALILRDANELGIYAAGKRTVNYGSFGTQQSNPVITLPGVTCNSTAVANHKSSSGDTFYSITLPADWGVYMGDWSYYSSSVTSGNPNNYQYWYLTPSLNTQGGVYKLSTYSSRGSSAYHYIQVGTSTTLVWDADTATP